MIQIAQPEGAIEDFIASLHHTFGDNDLIVARRQQRAARGAALDRWTEVVGALEAQRDWQRR